MGSTDAGRPGSGADDEDPFSRLLDPAFASGAAVREPSADERIEAAERAARQAALQRRLAEQEEHERQLAERVRRGERALARRSRTRRWIGPLVVVVLVGVLVWAQTSRRGGTTSVAADQPAPSSPSSTLSGSSPSSTPSSLVPTSLPRRPGVPPPEPTATTPLGAPPPAPVPAGPFELVRKQKVGTGPVAWDPCRPVRYVINPAGAPPGAEELLRKAIDNTATATGLRFEDAGTTDETYAKEREPYQPTRYGDRWAPVLISWATAAQAPDLAGYVVGFAGASTYTGQDGRMVYVSGQVVLDAEDLRLATANFANVEKVRGIVQHELGHLVGLDHVADPTQLMYTESQPLQTDDWGTGDLAGLHELGTGACFPDV